MFRPRELDEFHNRNPRPFSDLEQLVHDSNRVILIRKGVGRELGLVPWNLLSAAQIDQCQSVPEREKIRV